MNVASRVLGAAGVCGVALGLAYIVRSRGVFSRFEATFFDLMIGSEVVAEVVCLCATMIIMLRHGTFEAKKVLRTLAMDPFHHIVGGIVSGEGDEEIILSAMYIFIFSISTPLFMIWPWIVSSQSFYSSGLDRIQLAWVICDVVGTLVSFCYYLLLKACTNNFSDGDYPNDHLLTGLWVLMMVGLYDMQKVVGVCILLSDPDRLFADILGKAFLCLQIFQIVEVTLVVLILLGIAYWATNGRRFEEERLIVQRR